MNCLSTSMFKGLLFTTEDKKKIKYKWLNEMKCQVYTILHLVLLVKMKNIIPDKIANSRYLKKIDITKKAVFQ